tara:strand:- start:298 stop:537 length:240 start_codon:yes stop_codon:yes gene_type:complete
MSNKLALKLLEHFYVGNHVFHKQDGLVTNISNANFKYSDHGNCYSCVTAHGYVNNDKDNFIEVEVPMGEFLIFLGEQIF